jgi:endonuclease/exonuclease/phosphatase family metal-dependent hydrolase
LSDVAFSGLAGLVTDGRFIVAGDWNTARRYGERPTSAQALEFFDRARKSSWNECATPGQGKEMCTWFKDGQPEAQLDHAFCDSSLWTLFSAAWVASDAVLRLGLSDHAPLVIDFDVEPVSMTSRGLSKGNRSSPSSSSVRANGD